MRLVEWGRLERSVTGSTLDGNVYTGFVFHRSEGRLHRLAYVHEGRLAGPGFYWNEGLQVFWARRGASRGPQWSWYANGQPRSYDWLASGAVMGCLQWSPHGNIVSDVVASHYPHVQATADPPLFVWEDDGSVRRQQLWDVGLPELPDAAAHPDPSDPEALIRRLAPLTRHAVQSIPREQQRRVDALASSLRRKPADAGRWAVLVDALLESAHPMVASMSRLGAIAHPTDLDAALRACDELVPIQDWRRALLGASLGDR